MSVWMNVWAVGARTCSSSLWSEHRADRKFMSALWSEQVRMLTFVRFSVGFPAAVVLLNVFGCRLTC